MKGDDFRANEQFYVMLVPDDDEKQEGKKNKHIQKRLASFFVVCNVK